MQDAQGQLVGEEHHFWSKLHGEKRFLGNVGNAPSGNAPSGNAPLGNAPSGDAQKNPPDPT